MLLSHDIETTKPELEERIIQTAMIKYGREVSDLTNHELYVIIAEVAKQYTAENWIATNKAYAKNDNKQVYYFSIEFLIGRLLNTNLLNLDIKNSLKSLMADYPDIPQLHDLYDEEPDAGLGNGGLGRLAACFIDSMASLGLPAHGCGIRYQYGLFEQKIINGNQVEIPDNWLRNGFVWEFRKPSRSVNVRFGGNAYMKKNEETGELELAHENYTEVLAVPYDVPVVGYLNRTVNTLRLWNAEVKTDFSDMATLNQEQIHKRNAHRNWVNSITQYLYPDDSTFEGRKLRLVQEYFFVSAGVQSIIRTYKRTHKDLYDFADKIAIHINDTHPALCVAELMRILVDEEEMDWSTAWDIVVNTCGYTNHTIMPEALEKWGVDLMKELLPRIYMIIDEINRRHLDEVREAYPNDEERVRELSIIQDGQVHMARLSIVGSHSVNGVAKLHTEILKSTTLHKFYEYYPEKFNNKTNGITHRRWLLVADNELAHLIDSRLTRAWRHDAQHSLAKIMQFIDDPKFQKDIAKVKSIRKRALAQYVQQHNKIKISTKSMFDIQVKRIHSYKRQLMNILHIMYVYDQIKNHGYKMQHPVTCFFGGKAASAYYVAKETIRLINAVADKVNNDPDVKDMLKVVFLENFCVSLGELVYPAADVSEQISTASKEASGTGNMKFMMNGAITLGTLDGANIEIRDEVGDENCVIFGLRSNEVLNYYANGNYSAWDEYNNNPMAKAVMNMLTDGTFGDFHSLYDYLLNSNDEFFILKDLPAYAEARKEIVRRYMDKTAWVKSCIVNIARSGIFSSDRTIAEYAKDIWDVKPVDVQPLAHE